ncbi:MAG TPA: hypothetical protein C5S50_10160 [Methanosarcinaceae archaeon]|nr:hypothetical protein [Methanosarcinaceae archaeon]
MSNDKIAPNIKDNSSDLELIKVVKDQLKKTKEAKFAIGYFFLSGFSLVKEDFPDNYDASPFLKIVIGNETIYLTKEEMVAGYNLRELFKQRMMGDLQTTELGEDQIRQLSTLKDFVANNIIDVKFFNKSRLHAKLYLFLTNPEEEYSSPDLAVLGSSNFTSGGLYPESEYYLLDIVSKHIELINYDRWSELYWKNQLDEKLTAAGAKKLAALEKANIQMVGDVYGSLRGDGEVQEWIERIRRA